MFELLCKTVLHLADEDYEHATQVHLDFEHLLHFYMDQTPQRGPPAILQQTAKEWKLRHGHNGIVQRRTLAGEGIAGRIHLISLLTGERSSPYRAYYVYDHQGIELVKLWYYQPTSLCAWENSELDRLGHDKIGMVHRLADICRQAQCRHLFVRPVLSVSCEQALITACANRGLTLAFDGPPDSPFRQHERSLQMAAPAKGQDVFADIR